MKGGHPHGLAAGIVVFAVLAVAPAQALSYYYADEDFERWSNRGWNHFSGSISRNDVLSVEGTAGADGVAFRWYTTAHRPLVVEFDVSMPRGPAGGLFLPTEHKARTAATGYLVEHTADGYRLVRLTSGAAVAQNFPAAANPGTSWHRWRVELQASEVILTVDGAEVGRLADATHTGPFHLGFWAGRSKLVLVDNVTAVALRPDLPGGSSPAFAQRLHFDPGDPEGDGTPIDPRFTRPTIFQDVLGSPNRLQLSNYGTPHHAGNGSAADPHAIVFTGGAMFAHTRELSVPTDGFALAIWFRTSQAGGFLSSFEDEDLPWHSYRVDRRLYLDDAGRLVFAVNGTQRAVIRTEGAVTDDRWHLAVASQPPRATGAGPTLHLDGVLVGSVATHAPGPLFEGYWIVGQAERAGWPHAPANNLYRGHLGAFRVFDRPLNATEAAALHAAGPTARPLPGVPPTLAMRLDAANPAGTGVAPSGTDPATVRDASGRGYGAKLRNMAGNATSGYGVVDGRHAFLFDGVDDLVVGERVVVPPDVFTLSFWFRTTKAGGKLAGLENAENGVGNGYDRHVYMRADGRLWFGTWGVTGGIVSSPQRYDDGKWHHVAASMGAAGSGEGTKLWVDGVLVNASAANGKATYSQARWRLGGGNLNNWAHDTRYFQGAIAEFEVHHAILGEAEVLLRSGPRPAPPPPPTPGALPDLTVLVLGSDRGVEIAGIPTRFHAVVANSGPGPAPATTLRFGVNGTTFEEVAVPPLGPANATVVSSRNWTPYPGANVSAVVDAAGAVAEGNEANNTAFYRPVVAPALPQLRAGGLALDPPAPRPGDNATLILQVDNDGYASAGPFDVEFHAGNRPLGRATATGLAAGANATLRSAPFRVEAGDLLLRAVVDPAAKIPEENRDDNTASRPLHVAPIPAPANLRVRDVWMTPREPEPGRTVRFAARVDNDGGREAPATVRFLLDGVPLHTAKFARIGAGQTLLVEAPAWNATWGPHELVVRIEQQTAGTSTLRALNGIPLRPFRGEALTAAAWTGDDPADDAVTLPFRAGALAATKELKAAPNAGFYGLLLAAREAVRPLPDLSVLVVWSSSDPAGGRPITFLAAVANDADVSAGPFDVSFEVDGKPLGLVRVPGLGARESVTLTSELWTPRGVAPVVRVVADAKGAVAERNETNNEYRADLALSATDPRPARLLAVHVLPTPLSPRPGDEVNFVLRLENTGGAASAAGRVRFLLNDAEILEMAVPAVPAGAATDLAGPWWTAVAGRHVVRAEILGGGADGAAATSFTVLASSRQALGVAP